MATETTDRVDPTEWADAHLDDLRDDGDTIELPDGRALRLVLDYESVDDWSSYWEDVYGRIGYGKISDWSGNHQRPDGFDGAAEILVRDRHGHVWWQPPADLPAEHWPSARRSAADLIEYGQTWIALELLTAECSHCNAGEPMPYGHDCRVLLDREGMGGIEPFPEADYVQCILSDLLGMIEWDRG